MMESAQSTEDSYRDQVVKSRDVEFAAMMLTKGWMRTDAKAKDEFLRDIVARDRALVVAALEGG